MPTRIGINGFGRMGRLALRAGDRADLEFVHIKAIAGGPETAAHLLTLDSVHGRWNRNIEAATGAIAIEGQPVGFSIVVLSVLSALPPSIGQAKKKAPFAGILSNLAGINRLSLARLALFAARDLWCVVSVPIFLASVLGWTPALTMLTGLAVFGVLFALNSSVDSYLVLAYSEADRVSQSVGFYYMANACGRLLGTLLSGVLYQQAGVAASLWGAVVLAAAAGAGALFLPPVTAPAVSWAAAGGDE